MSSFNCPFISLCPADRLVLSAGATTRATRTRRASLARRAAPARGGVTTDCVAEVRVSGRSFISVLLH